MGTVTFEGRDITRLKAHQIAQLGIGRAFQASTLFMRLSVFDNVFNGFHLKYKVGAWRAFLHTPRARIEERHIREKVMEILEFMGLAASKDQLAQNLPYGHQKTLGVCIALATGPKLLLLDEPLCGMHPEETSVVLRLIQKVRASGITIVLVEHNMDAVMRVCDRVVVLTQGRKIAAGSPQEISENPEVIEAYLGTDEEDDLMVHNGCFLNGITRQRVIQLLRDDGIKVEERTVKPQELDTADEIFSTGNYGKVMQVTRYEDRNMQPGPIGRRARELYWQFAAKNPA